MRQKTLTISKDAYNALKRMKRYGESFSDVIIRITKSARLLDHLESTEFPQELTDNTEKYTGKTICEKWNY
ncbi:MAG: antitoxin VapB family protein [Archaeoglobus sp.]|nr:antitoxin VapB family protein [Archaeoglobus sp.]